MIVRDLIWLEEVEEKIVRKHQVYPEEVEEIFLRRPQFASWSADIG